MKSTLFLRIASVLTFIHAVLHTVGGVFGKVEQGPAAVAVEAMKANQFLLMGNVRSFWLFYRGLGLVVTIALTAEAVLFWQLGSLAKKDARRLRPILATFLVAYSVLAVNSYMYFFLGPVVVEILIAGCLGLTMVTANSQAATSTETSDRA
jgi:D-alanyl-lipoteichoic acid acyltransferase DltB (MBOAT superfamily)